MHNSAPIDLLGIGVDVGELAAVLLVEVGDHEDAGAALPAKAGVLWYRMACSREITISSKFRTVICHVFVFMCCFYLEPESTGILAVATVGGNTTSLDVK